MKRYYPLFFLAGWLLFSIGCKNFHDIESGQFTSDNAEFAIPLVNAKTSLQDILEAFDDQTFIEIAPDGLITLRYFGDVVSRTSEEIIGDALASLPEIVPLTDTLVTLPFESPNELEVDFATFSRGAVRFAFAAQNKFVKEITFEFPEAFKDGQTLQLHRVFNVPQNLVLPVQVPPVELEGFDLIPENGELHVRYEAYDENGDRIKFDFAEGDQVFIEMKDLGFSYIEGYLGNHIHPGERDTINIEFLENWIAGEVYFEDPKVWVLVENSFGVPTESVIEDFIVHYADGGSASLVSPYTMPGEGIPFEYPKLDEVGEVARTVFPFNKDNSNIAEILGSSPVSLEYKVDALTNPDNLVDVRGFLTDSSYYNVQVEVELPVYGKASGFAVTDTFDIGFDGYGKVDGAEFKVVADNAIPLDIDMQFYFTDAEGNVLDSLLAGPQRVIGAAQVNSSGIATEPMRTETFVPLDADHFAKIRDAEKVILNAWFSTINNGQTSVKVFSDQEVEIRMGAKLRTR
ncbi:MAG: hypothetical protein D6714_12505 [Bacteroidetes bacterium]|nr:MAG: hypothetical protein D6714_12505 [Bacteroidota bacterium]